MEMDMKTWYRLRAARKTAELLIYDEIGAWGKTSTMLLNELAALGDLTTINVRINSPGGDIFEAWAMHNALIRHPAQIITHIDGLCASAATFILLAGDEVRMADNAMLMIHEPWTVASGDAEAMQKQVDLLDTMAEQIVNLYARKTGADPADIRAWMQSETWYTADQALAAGFIDAIDVPIKMAALAVQHDLTRFKNSPSTTPPEKPMPENTPKTSDAPTPPPATDAAARYLDAVTTSRLCLAAGEPGLIPILLAMQVTEDDVKARVARAAAVRQICAVAKQPDLAVGLIAVDAGEDAAKAATWAALVARDEAAPVDTSPPAAVSAGLSVDDRCAAEWSRDPALRAEFGTLAIYTSYSRAQAAGRINLKSNA
jgi:ATP-dependent protease ClpP protease subunit